MTHPGSRGTRRHGWTVAAILSLLLSLSAIPAAQAQPIQLLGLQDEALVVFDGDDVPHVCGTSEHDVFFLQGYLHARDRFFQMDNLRRLFSGTLAELLGPGALSSDVQLRTLGLRRAAQESLTAYEELAQSQGSDTLAALEAYARGVNAFLDQGPLPPEYGALEITSVPEWTVVDSLTVGKGLAFGLSFDLSDIDLTVLFLSYQTAGQALGFNGAALFSQDLVRSAPFDDTVSLPEQMPVLPDVPTDALRSTLADPTGHLTDRTLRLAKSYRGAAREIPMLEKALEGPRTDTGSNWWVLSGDRTATGNPMLANDPHLGLNTPATFYETHLLVSDVPGCGIGLDGPTLRFTGGPDHGNGPVNPGLSLNVNGVSFAGAPGIVQGCNSRVCWGSTVNPMDVTDVYVEELALSQSGLPVATRFEDDFEPLVVIPQTFFVNQVGDGTPDNSANAGLGPTEGGVTLIVPRRNRGPIVQLDTSETPALGLSVQYTGWRATLEFEAFLRYMRAGTVEEFRQGVQFFDVGSQNWAYADVDGNIAYFTSAEMPIREDLQSLMAPDGGVPPFFLRDGTHGLRHEWLPVQNPQPQQTLSYEILPFAEMPQTVNPARGYVINANNDPIGTSLDNNPLNQVRPGGGLYYLSPGYVSLRVGRIGRVLEELLADGGTATLEDLQDLQANNQLLDAELAAPFLVQALTNAQAEDAAPELAALAADPAVAEAVERIAGWDWSTPTGLRDGYDPGDDPDALPEPSAAEVEASVAATLWAAFRGQVIENVVDETLGNLGLGDFAPGSREAYKAVVHLLRTYDQSQGVGASGLDFFNVPGDLSPEDERDVVLLSSLREALDLLAGDAFDAAFGGSTDQDDYRWGRLHRIVFDHPLGGPFSVPPAGGFSNLGPGLPGVARSGGYEAVDASAHSPRADGLNEFMFGSGPARRFVGELDPNGIAGREILPGGQRAVLGDPGYANQLPRWLTNRYHPLRLSQEAVRQGGAIEQTFTPPPPCTPTATDLCFQDGRFRVTVDWITDIGGNGPGRVVPFQSDDSGLFYFFEPDNWEMLVKVLDACPVNDRFWVFASATTNVGWELVVEDTRSGESQTYVNPVGQPSRTVTDANAFATCP